MAKFENEDISEVERDLALEFIRNKLTEEESKLETQKTPPKIDSPRIELQENNITNIKLVREEEQTNKTYKTNSINEKDLFKETTGKSCLTNKNKTLAIINNKVITRVSKPPTKSNHPLLKNQMKANNSNIMKDYSKKEIEELRIENKQLADKNKTYEMEISTLKLELESLRNLNKEFETQIVDYKRKLELKNDVDKKKLKKECELWKREYVDLLDKSMSTNVSTSRIINTNDHLRPQTAKFIRKNSLDESSESINDADEDAEIDEMLRKSVTNLEQLKSTLK